MKAKLLTGIAILLVVADPSSADQALSRADAKTAIERSQEMIDARHRIPLLSQEAIRRGGNLGVWEIDDKDSLGRSSDWLKATALTQKGAEIFYSDRNNILRLREPLDIALQVTGITDAPQTRNIKQVEFEWQNLATGIVHEFMSKGGFGSATFRLYDDGWRLTSIRVRCNDHAIADQTGFDLYDALKNGIPTASPNAQPSNSGNRFGTAPNNGKLPELPAQAEYPVAQWSDTPGAVISPFPPHNLIDVKGIPPGALVLDHTTNKIFKRP